MKTNITSLVIIAILSFNVVFSQPPLKQWDVGFGGSSGDYLYALQQTRDGGYILGGYSNSPVSGDKTQPTWGGYDYWIVKTDANGVKQWDQRFGGSEDDYLIELHQTKDGGYILAGWSESYISGDKTQLSQGKSDYWIVKTDENGLKQWDSRFGGNDEDYLSAVLQTSDGGYLLGGYSFSHISGDKTEDKHGKYDYWIVKTDVNGVKQWDADFGGGDDDYLLCLLETIGGGYLLGGNSESPISGDKTQDSQGGGDFWIVKITSIGMKIWDATFGGLYPEELLSVQQTKPDGGFILGGYSSSPISGDKTQPSQGERDYWIVKTTANGIKQWDARFGGGENDQLSSLQQTDDGGFILGGYSLSPLSGDKTQPSQGGWDYWIVKTDFDGLKQWDLRFGGSSSDYLKSLHQTTDGGYILGGYSFSPISGDKTQPSQSWDYWMLKTTAEGMICNSPTTLSATDISSTTAQLKWKEVSGAVRYEISYKSFGTSVWNLLISATNKKNLTGLVPNTKYVWKVKAICQVSPLIESPESIPSTFVTSPLRLASETGKHSLEVYPNPLSNSAMISLSLYEDAHAVIELLDVSGRKLQTILDENLSAGNHELILNRGKSESGIYFLEVTMDDISEVKKVVIE